MLKKILKLFMSAVILFTALPSSLFATENSSLPDQEMNFKMYEVGRTKKGEVITSSMPKEQFELFMKGDEKFRSNFPTDGRGIAWDSDKRYMTPIIKIGNEFVFCNNAYKDFPNGGEYDDGIVRADLNGTIGAIQQHGFPYFAGGRPAGLSNEQAYVGVFIAINAHKGIFNRNTVQSKGNAYVNNLLAQADNKNFTSTNNILEIHPPQNQFSHFDPNSKRLESDYFLVRSTQPFRVTGLPAQLSVVNENGHPQDYFPGTAHFRIVTDYLSYHGDIVFGIETDFQMNNTVMFSPKNTTKQQLTCIRQNPHHVVHHTQVNFRPLKIGFIGVKHDESGVAVHNAKFGLFRSNGDLIHETLTDSVGTFSFPMTDVNEFFHDNQAYVQEIGTPNDDMYIPQTTKFFIPSVHSQAFKQNLVGSNYKINGGNIIYNHFKKGSKFILKKIDKDTKQPLANVQFTLKRRSGRPDHPGDYPFTAVFTTDEKGEIVLHREDLHNFLYGEYVITEIKTLDGYIEAEVEYTFTITQNDQVVEILIENTRKPLEIIGNKVDENGNYLSEVEFGLFSEIKEETEDHPEPEEKEDLLLLTAKTDITGKFHFSNIKFEMLNQNLYVKEIKPQNDKYVTDTNKYYLPGIEEIDDDPNYSLVNSRYFLNYNTPIKNIKKSVDIVGVKGDENNNILENVKYGLFNGEDELLKEETTNEIGVFNFKDISLNIFDGSHYVQEISTKDEKYELDTTRYYLPKFEDLDTDPDFNIEDQRYVLNRNELIVNYTKKGNIQGYKTDENKAPLEGVKFALFNPNHEVIQECETSSDGIILFTDISLNIFDGKHYIKETKTCNSSYVPNEIVFYLPGFETLDTDENFDITTLTFYLNNKEPIINQKKKGTLLETGHFNPTLYLAFTGVAIFIVLVTIYKFKKDRDI